MGASQECLDERYGGMKIKRIACLAIALMALGLLTFVSAEELVYGTATLTYAEFYAGDVSDTEGIDAVTSATVEKHNMFANEVTDYVDGAEGYRITGVANVSVAVPAADAEAYQAVNPTFVEVGEAPAQYKTVTVGDGVAVYGATVFNVAATVTDAEIAVRTDTQWGDYQLEVAETSTQYIRNTREEEGFAIGSGVQGVILETASGLKVGMEHMQSIWIQPWEISWNVSVDNSHNREITYDNLSGLDALMGETVTKVTFINPDAAYVYETEGVYIPVKFEGSFDIADAAADGSTAGLTIDIPEDFTPDIRAEGLEAVAEDGQLTWTDALPGGYTATLRDAGGRYAQMQDSFTLTTDAQPVRYDPEAGALVPAEDADAALAEAFIANLTEVTVDGKAYSASGRGAVVIVNAEGAIDPEAAATQGRGKDATMEPVFAAAGTYEITATATGFTQPITFTAEIVK